MNADWQTFLTTRDLRLNRETGLGDKPTSDTPTASLCATTDYSILAVKGEGAANFLQGQTTCDVLGLADNTATHGAICNPKGRVFTNFMLFAQDSGFWLIVPSVLAASIEKRLRMYVLRSPVSIDNIGDSLGLFGICCNQLPDSIERSAEQSDNKHYPVINGNDWQIVKISPSQWFFAGTPKIAKQQWIDLAALHDFAESGPECWRLRCILNGIPTVAIETSEVFVPQMINLDALGGISFKKGCYTGQEIVARMHYLGKLKRRMYLATSASGQLPVPGDPIFSSENNQSTGQVVNAEYTHKQEIRMLAVLRIDQADSANIHFEKPIHFPIKILELPYTF